MSSRRNLPEHFELLSEEDKETYLRLQRQFNAPEAKTRRNKRVDDFTNIIETLLEYANKSEEDKWKRLLVIGIIKFEGGIAVNISQLKKLVHKCKSSINGSLKRMGYEIVALKAEIGSSQLCEDIPYFLNHQRELRRWTIRYYPNERDITPRKNPRAKVVANKTIPKQESTFAKTLEHIDYPVSLFDIDGGDVDLTQDFFCVVDDPFDLRLFV